MIFHGAGTGAETTGAETTGAGTGAETTGAGTRDETGAETGAETDIEAGTEEETEEETEACGEEEIEPYYAPAEDVVPRLHAAGAIETTERRRLDHCQPIRIIRIDPPPLPLRSSWTSSPTKSRRSCSSFRIDHPPSKTLCASFSWREDA